MRDIGSMFPDCTRVRDGEMNTELNGQLRRPTYELCSRPRSVTGNPDVDQRIDARRNKQGCDFEEVKKY